MPGVYCWLALTIAGLSMYRLAREWLPGRDALFAAALYAINPYHLVIVYWRSAFAELLAAALLPLLLLGILRLKDPGLRPVLGSRSLGRHTVKRSGRSHDSLFSGRAGSCDRTIGPFLASRDADDVSGSVGRGSGILLFDSDRL